MLALSLACAIAVGGRGISVCQPGTQPLLPPVSTSVPVDPVLNVLPGSVDVVSVPSSAMIYPVSITVDEPLAVDSVPANVASVPAPVVVDPAPIIVDEPPVVPANTPVSDPVLVTEPVSPVPDVPVTATNISV